MLKFKSRKGQVAETTTWIVATVIILVVLTFFFFIAGLLGEQKDVEDLAGDSSVSGLEGLKGADWIANKNELAFGINSDNREIIKNWIVEVEARDVKE